MAKPHGEITSPSAEAELITSQSKELDFIEPGPKLRPSIFEYIDYRKFLVDIMAFKREQNPSFSESAFLRQAGFGQNSRGYFGLITKGKRNLSSHTLLGFGQACRLSETEMAYFEALVHYNQARTEKDKTFYFERLAKLNRGKRSKSFELLELQYQYLSNWYLLALRELVGLEDFQERPEWISQRLRGRINSRQIKEAIEQLIQLGLLKRDASGRLRQSEDFVEFTDTSLNYTIANKLHSQVLELANKALQEDDYMNRSLSTVMLSCSQKQFENIRKEIRDFRNHILKTYGSEKSSLDSVLNLSIQLFHVTPVKGRSSR